MPKILTARHQEKREQTSNKTLHDDPQHPTVPSNLTRHPYSTHAPNFETAPQLSWQVRGLPLDFSH
jgi:hypothetical protein